jgi:hypothetical protein
MLRHRSAGSAALVMAFLFPLVPGCAPAPGAHLEERRANVEAKLAAEGLARHPAIEAAQAELDAAIAQEDAEVAIDGVEVRAALVHETDDKATMLVRMPIRNPFELHEQMEARRAQSEIALARLEEATLAQRVAGCGPSLEVLVHARHLATYDDYSRRYRALLDWNREMRAAGMIDEVAAGRFELSSRVKLSTRDPEGLPDPMAPEGPLGVLDVLPEAVPGVPLLRADPDVLQRELLRHQPSIATHRARRMEMEALARAEDAKRVPSLRFVDIGFEPVAYPGDDRQIAARIAIEVPFGREASANARRYEALARAERSRERALVDLRHREASSALGEINAFRARGGHWDALSELADASEALADRWWRDRLADPMQIASLLDSVYAARMAVLDARRRAGRAGCAVVEATGVTVAEWPR